MNYSQSTNTLIERHPPILLSSTLLIPSVTGKEFGGHGGSSRSCALTACSCGAPPQTSDGFGRPPRPTSGVSTGHTSGTALSLASVLAVRLSARLVCRRCCTTLVIGGSGRAVRQYASVVRSCYRSGGGVLERIWKRMTHMPPVRCFLSWV